MAYGKRALVSHLIFRKSTIPGTTGKMNKTTAIRLSDNTYARLKNLALQTGRTATDYIQEAVETHREDLEDVYLAEKALEDIRGGLVKPISLGEMSQRLGLDN